MAPNANARVISSALRDLKGAPSSSEPMGAQAPLEEAICLAALEVQDPARQQAFLERACAGDQRLSIAVEEMLSADPKTTVAGKITTEGDQTTFTLTLPAQAPDPVATVVCLEVKP
jgi:hypothetical protein